MSMQAIPTDCPERQRNPKYWLEWQSNIEVWTESDIITETSLEAECTKPREYQVVMLNDDYTPMEFVVDVLMRFFGRDHKESTRIMLQIHHAGRAVCGVFPKDVAETKVMQVISWARKHEHPLMCCSQEV